MAKLWRCRICGDPYIGDAPPENCPFCGAHKRYIGEAKDTVADFDLSLGEKDMENVKTALGLELSNAAFYMCASKNTDDPEGRLLFKALSKIEAEHASIWKKILRLDSLPEKTEQCFTDNSENLRGSHQRETHAIEFYKRAAGEATHPRIQEIFSALVEVEKDHLGLANERLR